MKFRLNWLKLIPHVDFLTPLPGIYGSLWCQFTNFNIRMPECNTTWDSADPLRGFGVNMWHQRKPQRKYKNCWSNMKFSRKALCLGALFWVNCKLAIYEFEWLFQWNLVSLIYRCLSLFIQCLSSMILLYFVPFIWHYFVLCRRGAWASWISTANHSMQTCNWSGTVDPFTMDASR